MIIGIYIDIFINSIKKVIKMRKKIIISSGCGILLFIFVLSCNNELIARFNPPIEDISCYSEPSNFNSIETFDMKGIYFYLNFKKKFISIYVCSYEKNVSGKNIWYNIFLQQKYMKKYVIPYVFPYRYFGCFKYNHIFSHLLMLFFIYITLYIINYI